MNIVAVTSCPTGIAHSQMAAESLEQTADRLGHDLRVEIQGAMGAEDELGREEIASADAAIVAADTSVNRDRFEDAGVPVVKATVKDAINDPEGLFDRAREAAGGESEDTIGSEADAPKAEGEGTPSEPTGGETKREIETGEAAAIPEEQIGGDPRKGLFARLKRLLS